MMTVKAFERRSIEEEVEPDTDEVLVVFVPRWSFLRPPPEGKVLSSGRREGKNRPRPSK